MGKKKVGEIEEGSIARYQGCLRLDLITLEAAVMNDHNKAK